MKESRIFKGDCLEVMKSLGENSIDGIVTDPPYGLSFMGKHWDYDVPSAEIWKEALRVLKPGGYLLSFGGSRTYHRMACAIEDAGFEIRDQIMWIYGSGFPKSLDIGKAVDKMQGNERDVVGEKKLWGHNAGSGAGSFSKNEYEGITGTTRSEPLTKGDSEYEGWGTALKPAHEPICMARKPLSEKTVAGNVLKYGTGGINIDGCRVESQEELGREQKDGPLPPKFGFNNNHMGNRFQEGNPLGRFPANVIHDGSDEVVGMFPNTKSGKAVVGTGKGFAENPSGIASTGIIASCFGDEGSAARFFYCAKASKSERDKGLDNMKTYTQEELSPQEKTLTRVRDNGTIGENPYLGKTADAKNSHPTVKPVALMRYLCRLVTPKGGTVLDPFMGSGSTGVGAKTEGFNFIGIEREANYCKIAEARIAAVEVEQVRVDPQQSLF